MLQNSLIDPLSADGTDKRRKNADAQAAFRARRAKYITTLEETVTLLEATLVELQESCRANKADAKKLQADATGLRNEARDREKFWRAVWQTKKTGMPPDPTDDVSLPSYARTHSSPPSVPGGMISESSTHYDPALRFPHDPFSLVSGFDGGPPPEYPQRSPALDYPDVNGNGSIIMRLPSVTGYPPYPVCTLEGSSPADESWQQPALQGHTDYPMIDGSRPPITYAASLTVTSDAPPVPYPFNSPEDSVIPDFRYSIGARELTLHGGTADIPVAGSVGNNLRHRLLVSAHTNTMPNPSLVPAPYPQADNTSDDRGSNGSDSMGCPHHSTVATASSSRTPRSPSPNPLHSTLNVIKRQAFGGTLRQSRKEAQESFEGIAEAVADVLSARWQLLETKFDTNVYPNKRPRRDNDKDTHP